MLTQFSRVFSLEFNLRTMFWRKIFQNEKWRTKLNPFYHPHCKHHSNTPSSNTPERLETEKALASFSKELRPITIDVY